MKLALRIFSGLFLSVNFFGLGYAQTASTSDNIQAEPIADRNVIFDTSDLGISKTVEFGADLAWANEQNFRRAIRFMGLDQIDVVRASFQPTYPLIDGVGLTQEQIDDLNWRLYLINTYVGPNTDLALNCDHPWVDDWYVGVPENWEQLIQATAQAFIDAGHNIISVAPFNEPDYGWGQGTQQDMYDITNLLNTNTFFDDIRLSGGNTLSCDEALSWYNYMVPAGVNEGNTHQLAGSFDSFSEFFTTVSGNGDHATDDELHNVVEGLVGYEYGMETGIWWGAADLARGEMVKAFDGERIGYAEHRPNWTAAAVYRLPDGSVKGFGGTSERQAFTTTYNFISKERAVFYDGQGPCRMFNLEMPGGTGYQQGQSNAERVLNITSGEDIQPYINGQYKLVNRATGQVMEVVGNSNGSNIQEASYSGTSSQHWDVTPVDPEIGGDFSYYRIKPLSSTNRYMDLYGFSLDNGGNINLWDIGYYGNQQWYLDYAGEGWFYIRSRESSYCVQVNDAGNVEQWEKTEDDAQQWRFLPIDAPIEFEAPSVPSNFTITANATSISLGWTASSSSDVFGYTILRSEVSGGDYHTIARNVMANNFVDNTVQSGIQYFYKIKAIDTSLNQSEASDEVSAANMGRNDLVCHLNFEGDTQDSSLNLNHAATYGCTFVDGYMETEAISLNGSGDFVQLSPDIANHEEISIAAWVNWAGFNLGQHLFEFSAGEDDYFYVSPSISGQTQFTIIQNGTEQSISAPALPAGTWAHLVVTLGAEGAAIYINGELEAESALITISPMDIKPFINYIGVNSEDGIYFEGIVDDFRLYNYQLDLEGVNALYNNLSVGEEAFENLSIWPVPAKDQLHIQFSNPNTVEAYKASVFNMEGRLMMSREIQANGHTVLDVASLTTGIYMLKLQNSTSSHIQKIVIK